MIGQYKSRSLANELGPVVEHIQEMVDDHSTYPDDHLFRSEVMFLASTLKVARMVADRMATAMENAGDDEPTKAESMFWSAVHAEFPDAAFTDRPAAAGGPARPAAGGRVNGGRPARRPAPGKPRP